MAKTWSPKDPQDIRDYAINWTGLVPADDPIVGVNITVPEDSDLELVSQTFTDITTPFRVAGGTVGASYDIDGTVTTASGQVLNATAVLKVAERILK